MLCWFIDQVLPLIEPGSAPPIRLTVAGWIAPDVDVARFRAHPRVTLLGPVTDLAPLYDAHRLAVAPTRFAAGTPYKVYEAAGFGVPVVTTTLLCDQLGWAEGTELLAAPSDDAAQFATKVLTLYRSEPIWQSAREAALDRLREENHLEGYRRVVRDLLPPKHSWGGERQAAE